MTATGRRGRLLPWRRKETIVASGTATATMSLAANTYTGQTTVFDR
jgi:hypothetical protein